MLLTIFCGVLSILLMYLGLMHCRTYGYYFKTYCSNDKCTYSSYYNKIAVDFDFKRDILKDVELVALDKNGNVYSESEATRMNKDQSTDDGWTVQFKV